MSTTWSDLDNGNRQHYASPRNRRAALFADAAEAWATYNLLIDDCAPRAIIEVAYQIAADAQRQAQQYTGEDCTCGDDLGDGRTGYICPTCRQERQRAEIKF